MPNFSIKQTKPSRKVYYQCVDTLPSSENEEDSDTDYDIDTSASILLASITKQNYSKFKKGFTSK